jgi:uncharacterized protein (DUF4213/DUF364 family)
MLLDYAQLDICVEHIQLGVHWTLCQAGSVGFAETCQGSSWAPSARPLAGRPLKELADWLQHWDRQQASVGLAAVNAAINREADMVYGEGVLFKGPRASQGCFDWFLPRLNGENAVVLGQESPFSRPLSSERLHMMPLPQGALPPEADYFLPRAEWIFIPAQSIADKTLPRILELGAQARCVLYGAQTPWLAEWRDFGIDYLIGTQIDDASLLMNVIAEGGDLSHLGHALSYRLIPLSQEAVFVKGSPASTRLSV